MSFDVGMICYTPVRAHRVEEFEEWVRSVAIPATDEHAETLRRWRLVRTDSADADVVRYALLFEGSDIAEFDLHLPLAAKYGEERADAEEARFEDMLASDQEVVYLTPVFEG